MTRRSFLGVAASGVVLAACGGQATGGSSSSSSPLNIRLVHGVIPSTITGLIFAKPKELGLKNYGKSYTTTLSEQDATSEMIPALSSKQIDIAFASAPSLAATVNGAHVDVKVFGDLTQDGVEGHFSSSWMSLESGPVKTVNDMRGKKVSVVAFNTAVDLALRVMLAKNNIDPKKDLTIIEIPFAQQDANLRQGKIDVACMVPPFYQISMAKGGLHKVFDSKEAIGVAPSLMQIARTEFMQQNAQVMKDFCEDYLIGLKWVRDPSHRDQVITMISQLTKQPESVYKQYLFGSGDFYTSPNGVFDPQILTNVVKLMLQQGIIKENLDTSKVIDFSDMKAAYAAVK